jgi:hypothetical protein
VATPDWGNASGPQRFKAAPGAGHRNEFGTTVISCHLGTMEVTDSSLLAAWRAAQKKEASPISRSVSLPVLPSAKSRASHSPAKRTTRSSADTTRKDDTTPCHNCGESFPAKDLQRHVKACPVFTPCPNPWCRHRFEAPDLRVHVRECTARKLGGELWDQMLVLKNERENLTFLERNATARVAEAERLRDNSKLQWEESVAKEEAKAQEQAHLEAQLQAWEAPEEEAAREEKCKELKKELKELHRLLSKLEPALMKAVIEAEWTEQQLAPIGDEIAAAASLIARAQDEYAEGTWEAPDHVREPAAGAGGGGDAAGGAAATGDGGAAATGGDGGAEGGGDATPKKPKGLWGKIRAQHADNQKAGLWKGVKAKSGWDEGLAFRKDQAALRLKREALDTRLAKKVAELAAETEALELLRTRVEALQAQAGAAEAARDLARGFGRVTRKGIAAAKGAVLAHKRRGRVHRVEHGRQARLVTNAGFDLAEAASALAGGRAKLQAASDAFGEHVRLSPPAVAEELRNPAVATVPCPQRCGADLPPDGVARHCATDCSSRKVECPMRCGKAVPVSNVQVHLTHSCPVALHARRMRTCGQCAYCGEWFPAAERAEHFASKCAVTVVCAHEGCGALLTRAEWAIRNECQMDARTMRRAQGLDSDTEEEEEPDDVYHDDEEEEEGAGAGGGEAVPGAGEGGREKGERKGKEDGGAGGGEEGEEEEEEEEGEEGEKDDEDEEDDEEAAEQEQGQDERQRPAGQAAAAGSCEAYVQRLSAFAPEYTPPPPSKDALKAMREARGRVVQVRVCGFGKIWEGDRHEVHRVTAAWGRVLRPLVKRVRDGAKAERKLKKAAEKEEKEAAKKAEMAMNIYEKREAEALKGADKKGQKAAAKRAKKTRLARMQAVQRAEAQAGAHGGFAGAAGHLFEGAGHHAALDPYLLPPWEHEKACQCVLRLQLAAARRKLEVGTLVRCEDCGAEGLRAAGRRGVEFAGQAKTLAEHRESECPERLLPCTNPGCGEAVRAGVGPGGGAAFAEHVRGSCPVRVARDAQAAACRARQKGAAATVLSKEQLQLEES